ncbi:hypothetical protein AB0M97_01645 [Streptomyces sp. NPDC051207]
MVTEAGGGVGRAAAVVFAARGHAGSGVRTTVVQLPAVNTP